MGSLNRYTKRRSAKLFASLDLRYKNNFPCQFSFRGQQVGDFRADLVVANRVVVELKAARALDTSHEAQLLNYLRAFEFEVGLLLNFGPVPRVKRLAFANEKKKNLRSSALICG
jgi:GxxExxY protein